MRHKNLRMAKHRLARPISLMIAGGGAFLVSLALILQTPSDPFTQAAPTNPLKPSAPSMTVSLGGTTSVDINNVIPGGPAKTGSLFVTTTTDNTSGYTTTINTDSNVDNCLKPTSATSCASTTNKISPTTGTIATKSTLNPNQWGASLATSFSSDPGQDNAWFAVPVNTSSPVTISNSTSPNNPTGTSTQLTFGSKVDISIPAITYQNTVVVTAVANAYTSAPTITSISPNTGPATGGTTITINGTNFNTAYQAFIDINRNGSQDSGEECAEADIISNTKITCQTPAAAADTYDVVVKTWGGATKTGSGTTATTDDDYTYQNPVPIVISVSPESGHFRGGETFTITGSGFTGATAVNFGGSACRSFNVDSDTSVTCVSSGISANYLGSTNNTMTNPTNTVSVNITNSYGTNTANTLFTYRYMNSSFTGGGSFADIVGTDIAPGSKIFVNGIECTNRKITSTTTAVCVSPARSTGSKGVTIQAPTSAGSIQNYSGCSALSVGTIVVLTDTRDGQNYRIRKMEDGKCWMIDNLKLAGGTTLTTDNTDLDGTEAAYFATAWASISEPVQNSDQHNQGVCLNIDGDGLGVTSVTGNYLTCDGTSTWSTDNARYIVYHDPTPYRWVCRNGAMINADSLTGCGYLYNWYTTTAGSNPSSATASICPSGWNLPTSTNAGVLNGSMKTGVPSGSSATNDRTTRPNWLYNGKWQGTTHGRYASYGSNSNIGTEGYYMMNYLSSSGSLNMINIGPSNIYTNTTISYYEGGAVRCIQ
jgi:uncharacterized protein (TIGR02145 family)